MLYLLYTILLNALIFIIFRIFNKAKINTFQAIVANYLACASIGIFLLKDYNQLVLVNFHQIWVQSALVLGVLFIFTFYLIAYTTQMCGITTATVANKMSLIIPVYFSLFVFEREVNFSIASSAGIMFALISIVLTSIKATKGSKNKLPITLSIVLPFLVFLFGGTIDSLINFSKIHISTDAEDSVFTSLIFVTASCLGLLILVIKIFFSGERIEVKSILAGIALGIPNFFSIFYLVKALGAFKNNGALIYPLSNIGIIVLSSIMSVLFFREKLTVMNKIGLLLSIVAMVLIANKEILSLFKFIL